MFTWDVLECYARVCEQKIRYIHGIVISQGPRTTPWQEHALRTLHGHDFLNVSPLQKDRKAGYFYIQRRLINPLRVVHYLANHAKKRILGYIPCYGENSACSANQILLAAPQGDCPTGVATKWTDSNDNLYNQAATS
jgi:hypothetical protein